MYTIPGRGMPSQRSHSWYAIDVRMPLTYNDAMIFIETSVFTRQVLELLTAEEYAEFQSDLAANPLAGNVIEGTDGLRKVRAPAKSRGKARRRARDLLLREQRCADPAVADLCQGTER
ncbi:MAG TPA: hypothetical protein VKV22_08295 [Rhodanobacteraceae bacterium]|nr:hypothetical protein [Rhodanobacteraceae bacterium]